MSEEEDPFAHDEEKEEDPFAEAEEDGKPFFFFL